MGYTTRLSIFELLLLKKDDIKTGVLTLDDNPLSKSYSLVVVYFDSLPTITYSSISGTVRICSKGFTLETKPENFTSISLINHSKHLCISVHSDLDKYYAKIINSSIQDSIC